ncbi:winged helix-turn-helix transcriptional regulator [Haladaptatus halobius]|uniref:winged helix-turn-helix transcriptional regulator n=1 Tax=Haladaptatus halobius TaxID=2884875 RepID=UPI001D0B49F7|nr:helix-turn-helix domain-containing protein [Haladaptatus halobius]
MQRAEHSDWQRTWHGLWDILGCKWTFHIIRLLSTSEHGFNEMERVLKGITSTMLSRRLKQLESEGIVSREVEQTSPPTTTYRLTETGRELSGILREIEELNPTGNRD